MRDELAHHEAVLHLRIASLTRRNRRLQLTLLLLAAAALGAIGGRLAQASPAPTAKADVLRVRGLVVVDENGTERVWIGAPVPEPRMLGKRMSRGGDAAGILLFDEEGNERSGYVTTDGYPNVLLTLDAMGGQRAFFLAEPQGSPSLFLWEAGGQAFQLTVGSEGPSLRMLKDGEVVVQQPGPAAAPSGNEGKAEGDDQR